MRWVQAPSRRRAFYAAGSAPSARASGRARTSTLARWATIVICSPVAGSRPVRALRAGLTRPDNWTRPPMQPSELTIASAAAPPSGVLSLRRYLNHADRHGPGLRARLLSRQRTVGHAAEPACAMPRERSSARPPPDDRIARNPITPQSPVRRSLPCASRRGAGRCAGDQPQPRRQLVLAATAWAC